MSEQSMLKEFKPSTELRPHREQNLRQNDNPASRSPILRANTDIHSATVFPQDSFTTYILSGPFMLGQSLLRKDFTALNGSILLGSFVNISVAGYVVNFVVGKPNKMDPFGPMVVGAGQIISGMIFPRALPTAVTKQ